MNNGKKQLSMILVVVVAVSVSAVYVVGPEIGNSGVQLTITGGNVTYNWTSQNFFPPNLTQNVTNPNSAVNNIISTAVISGNGINQSSLTENIQHAEEFYINGAGWELISLWIKVSGNISPELHPTSVNTSFNAMLAKTDPYNFTDVGTPALSNLTNVSGLQWDGQRSNGGYYTAFSIDLTNETKNLSGMYHFSFVEYDFSMDFLQLQPNVIYWFNFGVTLNGLPQPVTSMIHLNVEDVSS